MTQHDFQRITDRLAELNNLTADQAADYMERIGGTPELNERDLLIVRNDDESIIAELISPEDFLDEEA